jgi:hypothetical protein
VLRNGTIAPIRDVQLVRIPKSAPETFV